MLTTYQQPITVHPFIDEVVECFLQFALYYQNDKNGIPLSITVEIADLSEDIKAKVYADVVDFCMKVRERTQQNFDPAQFGIDFYFARNSLITGFWDKPDIYGEYTEYLQTLSQQYQPFTINYV